MNPYVQVVNTIQNPIDEHQITKLIKGRIISAVELMSREVITMLTV
jgi:hypothetical protein